jgi:hypothetical protein
MCRPDLFAGSCPAPRVGGLDRARTAVERRVVDGQERLVLHVVPGERLGRVETVLGDVDVEPTRVRDPGVGGEVDRGARGEMGERPVAPGQVEAGEIGGAATAQFPVGDEPAGAARTVRAEHREPVVERRGAAHLLGRLAGRVHRFDLTGVGQPVLPAQEGPSLDVAGMRGEAGATPGGFRSAAWERSHLMWTLARTTTSVNASRVSASHVSASRTRAAPPDNGCGPRHDGETTQVPIFL